MNSGNAPFMLMGVTLGVVLSRVEKRVAWAGLAIAMIGAAITALVPIGAAATDIIYGGLWLSMIVTAVLAFVPTAHVTRLTIIAAGNVGAWSGALAGLGGIRTGLLIALPFALLFVPGQWIVARGQDVAMKVVASWMIAIASLSLLVSLMPTPGYKSDHMQ